MALPAANDKKGITTLCSLKEIRSDLWFIDSLANAREEPHEYDYIVFRCCKNIEKHLDQAFFASPDSGTMPPSPPPALFVTPLFTYIYLYEYPARMRTGKVPSTKFTEFIKIMLAETGVPYDDFGVMFVTLGLIQIYKFIQTTGYEADYQKIFRAIDKSAKVKVAKVL